MLAFSFTTPASASSLRLVLTAMTEPARTIQEGQWLRQSSAGVGVAPKYELDFGAADRLGIFDYYQFFTPSPIYLYGRFFDGPILDYMDSVNPGLQLGHHRFKRQIFDGMEALNGDPDWNFVLWGILKNEWETFLNFLLSVTITDQESKTVYRTGCHDLSIVDPLFADVNLLTSQPPRLDIKVLGVDGSRYAVAVEGSDDLRRRPRLKFHPPQKPTLAFAVSLFKGHGNPMDVWEGVRREEKDKSNESNSDTRSGSGGSASNP